MAIFAVDAEAAARVLPELSWLRPTRAGHKALVALTGYEHRVVSLGPYSELSLAVLVNDLWRPRPYDVLRDLLRRADVRRTGRHVVDLLVTTPEALAVGREIWGQPGVAAQVEVTVADRRIQVLARDPEHGGPLVELTGAIGPSGRVPQVDSVLYGRPDDNTVRTMVRVQRGMRLHPAPRARLRVGEADHPLTRHLRELRLQGARPLFVMTAPSYLARRSGGTILPR
ncbi:acetoacetate decarboxylase family protein [Kitasatospora gansuensis]